MEKKVFLVLVIIIQVGFLSVFAQEENGAYENFLVEENAENVIIKGLRDEYITHLTIPMKLNGKKVVLEDHALKNCQSIETITFEEGIEIIPAGLCSDCYNLKSVEIPPTVKVIDYCAFGNTGLEKVLLPDSIEQMGMNAFSNCKNLTYVDLGDLERLSIRIFRDCKSLKTVNHSGKLIGISDEAFYGCEMLSEIDLTSVETFGQDVFTGCKNIKYMNLGNIKSYVGTDDDYVDPNTMNFIVPGFYSNHESHYPVGYRQSFRNMDGLQIIRIKLPQLVEDTVYKPLFINCPNLNAIIFENFPAEMSRLEFFKTVGIRYVHFTEVPENLVLYGRGEDVKAYAESIGVPFNLLIDVYLDGERIWMDDCLPYIKNDRTMVPMRAIFEALGAEVSWDDETKTAIGVRGDTEIKITIGENVLYKNGEAIALDCAAEITNDRTMVPVRAISEAFGCTVEWNDETKTVEITN